MSLGSDLSDRAELMNQGKAVFCPGVLTTAADRIEALEAALKDCADDLEEYQIERKSKPCTISRFPINSNGPTTT